MKKLLKKSLSILLLGAALNGVCTINPQVEANAAWKCNSTGWWYTEGNSYVTNAWRYINGKWYYFDNVGYMKTGWLLDGQDWYYFNPNGDMKTGWVKSGQDWYFMGKSGAMETGWIKDGAKWYYLDPCNEGRMAANQWMFIGYHLDNSGAWDSTAKYLREDIFKNSESVSTQSGKLLYQAGDPSPLSVINGEPCVFVGTDNDEYMMIGLNTLNVYGDDDIIVDKVVLK